MCARYYTGIGVATSDCGGVSTLFPSQSSSVHPLNCHYHYGIFLKLKSAISPSYNSSISPFYLLYIFVLCAKPIGFIFSVELSKYRKFQITQKENFYHERIYLPEFTLRSIMDYRIQRFREIQFEKHSVPRSWRHSLLYASKRAIIGDIIRESSQMLIRQSPRFSFTAIYCTKRSN